MTVRILIGDVHEQLRTLPSEHFDCVVTSPPYWGLRDYEVAGQIGLEPTLGQHLAVMVDVFREVRRVLKKQGTCWLNYGDCYAASPNGRAAADIVGDDRAFRDKPFSTIGPVYDRTYASARGKFTGSDLGDGGCGTRRVDHGGRVVAGGYLKPKDLCMVPNRLAIALQEDGWWVRSEIIWHKPNPMPESVYDRPTSAHEKIWLLTKREDYFYNHEAIREAVTGGANPRKAGPKSRTVIDRVPTSRKLAKAGSGTKNNASMDAALAELSLTPLETRNARNVWTIAPSAFREAHFATFPPALAERCIKAGVPATTCAACGAVDDCGGLCAVFGRTPGRVLDPFAGAGTVGLVARQLGLDCTLIEIKPDYAEIADRRINGPAPVELA